jgi:hypothetical protein
MSGHTSSFDNPITASRKSVLKRDTSAACRERASEDLLKSVTMMTANERLILERSSANWSVRAELLEGVERSAAERRAAVSSSPKRSAEGLSK